jgi:large subunit ribosomal protein L3
MIRGFWGKKVGMTQVFSQDHKVIPVTVIDVAHWFVTQIKSKDKDGYDAVQLGHVRKRYAGKEFSAAWLKDKKKFFQYFREVSIADGAVLPTVGQVASSELVFAPGDMVDITGLTIGRGFQGGVKRHGFSGGRGSHGDKLGRSPGSLSFMRRQGRVIPGKRMPGHMGVEQRVMRNLEIVTVEPAANIIIIKGSVPGKTGSLVFVQKRG